MAVKSVGTAITAVAGLLKIWLDPKMIDERAMRKIKLSIVAYFKYEDKLHAMSQTNGTDIKRRAVVHKKQKALRERIIKLLAVE